MPQQERRPIAGFTRILVTAQSCCCFGSAAGSYHLFRPASVGGYRESLLSIGAGHGGARKKVNPTAEERSNGHRLWPRASPLFSDGSPPPDPLLTGAAESDANRAPSFGFFGVWTWTQLCRHASPPITLRQPLPGMLIEKTAAGFKVFGAPRRQSALLVSRQPLTGEAGRADPSA